MAAKKKVVKKKVAKKKPAAKKVVKKKPAAKTGKKKAFGGYTICFKGRTETAEKIFGPKPIGPSDMTKKIWAYVKANKLAGK